MRLIIGFVCTTLLWSGSLTAGESKPSEASLRALLEVTHVKEALDTAFAQMDGMMKGLREKLTRGQPLSPERQQALDAMHAKTVAIIKEELSWEALEPMYLKIYGESFTQAEVDGMLKFYRSPVGRSVADKMPVVTQKSMGLMQERMVPMIQKIQKMAQESAAQMQKADSEAQDKAN